MVICLFSLFSMTLFCAEESSIGRMSRLLGEKKESVLEHRYEERRSQLIEKIRAQHSGADNGVIVLFANFEPDLSEFEQDSHFYYLTGLKEPGTVLLLNFSGESILYVPRDLDKRMLWVPVQAELVEKDTKKLGFSEIVELESTAQGPLFLENEYLNLREQFREVMQRDGKIFTLHSKVNRPILLAQRLILHGFNELMPGFSNHLEDISSTLFSMQHIKDESEVTCLRKAVAITVKAQLAVARVIKPGQTERQMRAVADSTMLIEGSSPGFYSIVPSGGNTTILHCPPGNRVMRDGDVVIVDIGAKCSCHGSYSADLSRTWPVSGKFSKEQREIYSIVFKALQHVEKHVRPGYWFHNGADESKSLFHITKKFFAKRNCDEFFPHGVGHHIGPGAHLDCTDNPKTYYEIPLQEGNTVAIEPGLYFSDEAFEKRFGRKGEGFGVRIESNYKVTRDYPFLLDNTLPRDPDAIESLMAKIRGE